MNETRDPFRGYYWQRRPWRTDAANCATWDYTGMTRQRQEDPRLEDRQLDYDTGLPMEGRHAQKIDPALRPWDGRGSAGGRRAPLACWQGRRKPPLSVSTKSTRFEKMQVCIFSSDIRRAARCALGTPDTGNGSYGTVPRGVHAAAAD